MKEILRLTVTLLLICAIVAAALAAVNGVAGPVIAQRNAEKTQQAVEKVLPGGGAPLESFPDETGLVTAVYASDKGYAVQVEPAGFNGTIVMMVGVVDGKVYEISVISQTETPSLGAVAASKGSAGENFRNSFIGLSGTVAVSKDGGEADTISGATITSRAVAAGVNAALAVAAAMG